MHIDEHFDLATVHLQLRKNLLDSVYLCLKLGICAGAEATTEVLAQRIKLVVAPSHTVWVDHGHNDELIMVKQMLRLRVPRIRQKLQERLHED